MKNLSQNQEKLLQEISERVRNIRSYIPKVGVFGNSGVGKSSLCNALFGKDVAKIADVKACTRKPQEILIGSSGGEGGIILVDVPGIGEDPMRQVEYTNLYKSLAPELDLVIWTIKADDRNYASGLDAYKEIFGKTSKTPVVFVVTQTDKTNDSEDWDQKNYEPGESQLKNIALKELEVSKRFSIVANKIVSIAVSKKGRSYNLQSLVDLIVEALPNEKKFSVTREAKKENVSDAARKKAEKGIWDSIKDFAGEAFDNIKEAVIPIIIESISKPLKDAAKWFKSLF